MSWAEFLKMYLQVALAVLGVLGFVVTTVLLGMWRHGEFSDGECSTAVVLKRPSA